MSSDQTGRTPLLPGSGQRDGQLVRPDGTPVARTIDGVLLRPAVTQADDRGEVVELLSEAWPETVGLPIQHVYLTTLMPGVIKGWVCHADQYDRSTMLFGRLRWVLYDGRADSPTTGLVQTLTLSERNRYLVVLPPGVWHAVENVGISEGAFVNMPTAPYRHEAPDKFRLPLDTPEIPFRFPSRR